MHAENGAVYNGEKANRGGFSFNPVAAKILYMNF